MGRRENQASPAPAANTGGRRRTDAGGNETSGPVLNAEQQQILQWIKKVRFKKKLFGGVSEAHVWKKIEELNSMYEASLVAERARYDALLEQHRLAYEEALAYYQEDDSYE